MGGFLYFLRKPIRRVPRSLVTLLGHAPQSSLGSLSSACLCSARWVLSYSCPQSPLTSLDEADKAKINILVLYMKRQISLKEELGRHYSNIHL